MDEYRASYVILFQAVSKALDALLEQNYGTARQLLIRGQQDAEEAFMQQETDPQKAWDKPS